jgi:hypothetical protein
MPGFDPATLSILPGGGWSVIRQLANLLQLGLIEPAL